MDLAFLLIGLGTLIVVATVLPWRPLAEMVQKWFHRDHAERLVGPPSFSVVALGLEGAGKTVLLATMFHELSTLPIQAGESDPRRDPALDRRYFLAGAGGYQQNLELADLYAEVSAPSQEWPPATPRGKPREYSFDCKALADARDERTVFRLSYIDYAGELLEAKDDGQSRATVLASVDAADALLVLIDGRRVRQFLQDERQGRDYFERRIGPILQLAGEASCPVQLILTKWDLVRSLGERRTEHEQLQDVIDRLDACGSFHMLKHNRRGRGLRMIPVSAVGTNFATLDEEGQVKKRADGRIEPIHVEVPLCTVLPDILGLVARSLQPFERRQLDERIRERVLSGETAISIVADVLGGALGLVLGPLRGLVSSNGVRLFAEMLVRGVARVAGVPNHAAASARDAEELTQRLRGDVVEHMQEVIGWLERRLPCSILIDPNPEKIRS
jgi:hypothetical protein